MPKVYLKGGLTEEVKLEELEDYLQKNREKIEPRQIKLGRPRMKKGVASTSETSSK